MSLPSTPDSIRRKSVTDKSQKDGEGDCLSEVDERDLSDGEKSRGDILQQDGDGDERLELPVRFYTSTNGDDQDEDCSEDGNGKNDDDEEKKDGRSDSFFSAV